MSDNTTPDVLVQLRTVLRILTEQRPLTTEEKQVVASADILLQRTIITNTPCRKITPAQAKELTRLLHDIRNACQAQWLERPPIDELRSLANSFLKVQPWNL